MSRFLGADSLRQNTELSAHEETEDESSSSTIIDNGEGSQAVDLERQKQIGNSG